MRDHYHRQQLDTRIYRANKEGVKHQCTTRRIIWIFMLVCIIFLFLLNVLWLRSIREYSYSVSAPRSVFLPASPPHDRPDRPGGFLIDNQGCRIPHMDPFDPSVSPWIHDPVAPNCNDGVPALYAANRTSISLVYAALSVYNLTGIDQLTCCYRYFSRRRPVPGESDHRVDFGPECVPVGESARIPFEFIQVTCHVAGKKVYTDFFSFVPLKAISQPTAGKGAHQAPLDVLIVGLDGVSRLNLHRQMPRTVEYLHNISAVEMLGYNKIADNTFPNVIAILTGRHEEDIMLTCCDEWRRFDSCPLIWDMYKRLGFVTAFGEDVSRLGIFNHDRNGFKEQPTDYMWGTFDMIAERHIGNKATSIVNPCIGSRMEYRMLLDHIGDFVAAMRAARRRYFALYWGATLSHDYLNMPRLGDKDYTTFFRQLHDSGGLNNTALFFISDHGIRYGNIRRTYMGHMEEVLPFAFVVLPAWFKEKYSISYRNLRRNARRLTTPFDMYETLVHLNNFSEPNDTSTFSERRRRYSLFADISSKRTCETADIPAHWCSCQRSFDTERNSSVVQRAADAIVAHMNGRLGGYAQCARLALKAVLDARMTSHSGDILTGAVAFKDYMLTVQTDPGDGIFESTVRHRVGRNGSSFEITGTVSRLNLYRDQSVCITDFHLKLYCYCKGIFETVFYYFLR